MRTLAGGFELDDDRARIDVDAVHRFLATESYWARGRPRDVVARLVDASLRPARVSRPRLGVELVREAVENGPHAGLRWLLHTDDAHRLYARFGFGAPSDRSWSDRRGSRGRNAGT